MIQMCGEWKSMNCQRIITCWIFHLWLSFFFSLCACVIGCFWSPCCINSRDTGSPWNHIQENSHRRLPNYKKGFSCLDWFKKITLSLVLFFQKTCILLREFLYSPQYLMFGSISM